MAFGFAGAHRTGKTTLAKAVAEKLGMHYHDASVTKIMREAGVNAVGDVPLEARIDAQEFLLKRFLSDLMKAPRPLVTDRTPLDMVGYCLGEVTMHNTTAEQGKRIDDYVGHCIDATINHFDTVIIVGPLAKYVADPTKPPPNPAYQSLVQFLVDGSAMRCMGGCYVEWMSTQDLQERTHNSCEIIHGRMAQLQANAKLIRLH